VPEGFDGTYYDEVEGADACGHLGKYGDKTKKMASDELRVAGASGCFPGSAGVQTSEGMRMMKELKLGDSVETARDFRTLETEHWLWDVHGSMGNVQATVEAEFLSIAHTMSDRPLRITADHMLFAARQASQSSTQTSRMLAARDVVVGDFLFVRDPSKEGKLTTSLVTNITTVTEFGVYAPFTWSGRLVVDGVLVSNYALFSSTLSETHDRHMWLPWERTMNFFNVFRYFHGLQLNAVFEPAEIRCPAWLCEHKDADLVSSAVLHVWWLADTFIVQPLGVFARGMEWLTSSTARTASACLAPVS